MTSTLTRHAHVAIKPCAILIAVTAVFPSFALAQAHPDQMLAPVVVTATRSPQAATDVLADNILITSEEIAQSGQNSLVDLLQRQRGIEIARNGGPGTNSSVFARGTNNNQTLVLIDGVRTGSSTSGGATWAAIPLSQIDHIEIVYGPLSSLYGADAVGGVVQIFTKKGDGAPHFTTSAGYGSYATRSLQAGVSGSTSDQNRFRYALNIAKEDSGGFSATNPGNFSFNPDKDGYKKSSASGQFSLDIAKGHEAGFNFLQSRIDSQFDNGPASFDARNESKLGSYSLYSKNRFLPQWTSLLQLSQSTDKLDSITSAALPAGTSTFNTKQIDLTWQNDIALGADVLQLLAERRKEEVDSTRPELARDRTTDSFAASYQFKRDAHLANVSVRNDRNSQFGSATTGSLAYGYRMTKALRVNASAGTSFRAPTFNELYYKFSNTNFYGIETNRPEHGKNAEIGLYYDDGKSQLSAVYYRNAVRDMLVYANPCPVSPATHTFGCAYNVNKALLTGVSLGAKTTQGNLTVRGTLDLQDPRDETADKLFARRARQHGTVAVEYAAGAIRSGAEMVFSGKRFDDSSNTIVLGGYSLLNLYGSYDFARDWSLFARWDNVMNKDYELARNYATAGSSVFVGVRYGFK